MSFFFQRHDEAKLLRSSIIIFLLVLSITVWLAIRSIVPQEKVIGAEQLQASQQDLKQITQERHPVGSEAHTRVLAYLSQRIRDLGLEAEPQTSFAINPRDQSAGQVTNIVVRLPANQNNQGNQNKVGSAILLAAHYDSVANSYGAGDDGVSVANMLQVMKQLQQEKNRRNDVIFLLSDGEEAGLLGAIAFAEQHPWSKDVGLVLNFDNRGSSGPIMMFETSADNGRLIQHLAQATPQVVSNSIMYEVYKALPNDTDFTIFRKRGIAGLNFAMIDNFSSYHTHHDRAESLDPGSLAQQQQLMRALSLHFVQQDLSELKANNHVYFSLPLIGLIHYSNTLALTLSILIVAALVALWIWQNRLAAVNQANAARLHYSFFASLLFLAQLGLLAFLGQRAWIFICRIYPEYASLREADNGHFYLLAFILLFATIFTYLQRWFCRWWRREELQFGAYLVWVVLLLVTSFVAPGTSFLFAWPLLLVLVAHAFHLKRAQKRSSENATSSPDHQRIEFWSFAIALLPAVILFAPLILLFNIALGMRMAAVPVVLSVLLMGLALPILLPIAHQLRRWLPLLAVKICIVLGALATSDYHKNFPEPSQLVYVSGSQAGQAWWASPNPSLNADLKQVLGADAEYKPMENVLGPNARYAKAPMWQSKAPDIQLAKPIIRVQKISIVDQRLVVQVKIDSPLFANQTSIALEGSRVLKASINGQEYRASDPEHWQILIHGRNQADTAFGNLIEFEVEAGKATQLRVIDTLYQMPPALQHLAIKSDIRVMSLATLDIH